MMDFSEKVDCYLSENIKTHNVVILAGTSRFTRELILEYAEEKHIQVEQHNAKWGKYRESGVMGHLDEMINESDAVIAFWDRKGTITGELISKARLKGLQCKIIEY